MTALYLLEPDDPGAAWAPFAGVRPIAELRAGRLAHPGAVGGGRRARRDGDPRRPRRAASTKATSRRCGRRRRSRARRSSAASWFAPTGDRDPDLARPGACAGCATATATVGWIVPPGERWEGPHERGDGARDRRRSCCAAPTTWSPRWSGFWPRTAPTSWRRPHRESPRAAWCWAIAADVDRHGRRGRAGRGVRRAPRRRRARARASRCATAPGSKGPSSSGRALEGAGRLHPRLGVRPGVPGARRDRGQSVFLGYANKSHDGFVGHSVVGHWVNLGARHHHVQSQEHLRPGPPRGRRASASRPAGSEPRHPVR